MICRIATHDSQPDIAADAAATFRGWMKEQPGFKAGYHLKDPASGRVLSISIWESKEHMMALKDKTPPGGPVGLKPSMVEIFPIVEEF